MIRWLAASLMFGVTMLAPLQATSLGSQDLVRGSLFEAANQALEAANAARANILAPEAYGAGAELYQRAEARFDKRGAIERIERDLEAAARFFQEAAEKAAIAGQVLASAMAAREDASSAGAPELSTELWTTAEQTMGRAALKLEAGSLKSGQKLGAEAEEAYRTAELDAIEASHLARARTLLKAAADAKARRYAPRTYAAAENLIEEAEELLRAQRYDTDRPRELAKSARQTAELAVHLAGVARAVDENDLSVEELVLGWQSSMETVGAALDLPLDFSGGHEQPAERMVAAVADLFRQIEDRNALEAELVALRSQLGSESAALEMVNATLERQAERRARLVEVESMFSADEAVVSRRGNQIVVRLVGLTFDSGRATLKPEHFGLLKKLGMAIALFPDSSILVEGHTDSFGSDLENLKLSEARADAVYAYLLANLPINPTRISFLGLGESRPIANNETQAGRSRNRRIEVVLTTDVEERG